VTGARVMVAMSGGVDSSVAAALLVEQGHEVTGVTLRLWGGASDSGCCSVTDVEDARRVAAQLGIPHYVFNLAEVFESQVVEPYAAAYVAGRTPNPCVDCNRVVKFGVLAERARRLGFERLATGHHARLRGDGDRVHVARGADPAKDQSYVLATIDPAVLGSLLLPVGELTKAEVRAHADRRALRTAAKPESMDVCFIRRGERAAFVAARTAAHPGAGPGRVVDVTGAPVATHDGVAGFTVGQRRGLGVAAGERRYVLDVDAATATVTIGSRRDLLRDQLVLEGIVRHDRVRGGGPTRCQAQLRAHGEPVDALLDGPVLRFASPQPRVAPGQVVALYDGDDLLGGGVVAA
jgi:tRNA-specific 2-thiouridylase